MKKVSLDYETMIQTALRGVVRNSLSIVQKNGLPSNHHFYITFITNHPKVKMPEYLFEEYPEEITIVLQHEFWDLEVSSSGFSVTLCFNDKNENLYVPYDAVISFVDPSVKFGLQFVPIIEDETLENDANEKKEGKEEQKDNVVIVDFSKKK
jgi:hypothetical protein